MANEKYIVVSPAYGRDYKHKSGAVQDWRSGKDFLLLNVDGIPTQTYCSNRDFPAGCKVEIRFRRKTELVMIKN